MQEQKIANEYVHKFTTFRCWYSASARLLVCTLKYQAEAQSASIDDTWQMPNAHHDTAPADVGPVSLM